jgi:hypothetical protein
MSNNKQSMKLYTKEDFLKAAEFCEVSMIDAKYIIERIDEVSDPIELPSDEEIREERLLQFPDSEYANRANDRLAFYCGAKFVINKFGSDNEME